ncbi:MAG: TIGR00159 family protein, partial [Oscillospiraceae bacterium]|nr:TIGR00159 family protein [Oscillospiraceae bacterium]
VVSEETGTISVAENGKIERNFTPENLRRRLRKELLLKQEDSEKKEEKSSVKAWLKKVTK